MAPISSDSTPSLTVRDFHASFGARPSLRLLAGGDGLENRITSPRIQKLGLAFAGYTGYLQQGRLQLIGRTEIKYLEGLDSARYQEAIKSISSYRLCCILITSGLAPPSALLEQAEFSKVPVLQTDALSSTIIAKVTSHLQELLAPTSTVHGVMMELFGSGVLLLGESGIGKSECALDLILRGHRLISDDLVILKKYSPDSLVGSGPRDAQPHIELRGLGIINLTQLFGVSVLSPEKAIDLVIQLKRWRKEEEYDRLGLEEKSYRSLEIDLPLITMPVAPGRNLATLVEVAVRIQMLKKRGYNPAREAIEDLEGRLRKGFSAQGDGTK